MNDITKGSKCYPLLFLVLLSFCQCLFHFFITNCYLDTILKHGIHVSMNKKSTNNVLIYSILYRRSPPF